MASTPNPKSLAHDDYTVGWVCALDSELTAATAMLEQTHSDLPTPGDDTNAYTLGSISGHNIVIACLPIGKTGNNSAATVAVQMIRTFPSIRFGLMVGIGGGIPPNVKLGDVVVSTPTGSYPGVVQYDFGKAKDGGKFERTGALNNPPRSLLTAARKLQAEHERTGSRMPEYLDQLAQKYPRMASAYLRTDSLKDVLFEAKYSHVTKDPAADEEEDEHDDGHDAVARQGTGRSADENGFFLRIIVQWLVAMWAAWIQSVGGGIWQQPAVQNVVPQTGFATEEDDCPHCDKTRIAKMTPRVADDGDVHYGLIASGNKVVKDAMVRNRIKRSLENQALCVEMEAAGLMDNFPCMVIRGICDYADSHKNDRWQKHAAAVAAAFARELLSHVQPSDVRAESTVKHILDHIRSDVQECRENVGAIRWTLDNKEHLEILDWLTPVNYGPQHSDYFNRRQPGTGQWLLDTNEFRQWVEGRQQTLFCPGMPGSGKTMLASIVVNKLIADFRNNSDIGIAYLYCNWKDRQNTEDLISSVLKQLAQGRSTLPQTLKSLHDRHSRQKTRPSFDEILESLHSVASGYTRVFLVIDALDECQASDGCRDRLLSEMFALRAKYEANLFATSRDIPEITARFTQSMMVEVRASDGDVRRYIEGHIDRHMPPLREHIEKFPQLKEEIVTGITAAVQGMFLLAQIYLGLLNDKVTPKKVRDALAEFQGQASREGTNGKQIANAYDQTMARIMGQEQGFRDLAKGALSWITCAERPLTTVELQHALAVEQNASELSEDNFPGIKLIVSVCAGLVTVNEQNGIIRLVHYTTQEYFEQTQGTWFPEAQSDITRACICSITCLSSAFDSTVDCGSGASGFNLDAYPFAAYAVLNWGYHARKSSKLHGVVIEFLECPSEVAFFACERHQTPDPARSVLTQNRWRNSRLPAKSEREAIGQNGLHLAAAFGFHEVLHLLQHLDPNARDNFGRTPLAIAARIGQAAFAEILLKTHQPEIDSRDYGGQTPLSWAAERGHETVLSNYYSKAEPRSIRRIIMAKHH
ncbi:ankyrin repeat-containing protein [Chaetomium fimeti]|uniref:Ankyrin repeat-containing protein n=1 Tax=Chaetomium fimeti TaxID=1854472 RepID=A0AAE0LW85_9PEZI|nr:ankyrin repeat-containing protein [Chaetomium fimeti]